MSFPLAATAATLAGLAILLVSTAATLVGLAILLVGTASTLVGLATPQAGVTETVSVLWSLFVTLEADFSPFVSMATGCFFLLAILSKNFLQKIALRKMIL
jgi:hypothetical protein